MGLDIGRGVRVLNAREAESLEWTCPREGEPAVLLLRLETHLFPEKGLPLEGIEVAFRTRRRKGGAWLPVVASLAAEVAASSTQGTHGTNGSSAASLPTRWVGDASDSRAFEDTRAILRRLLLSGKSMPGPESSPEVEVVPHSSGHASAGWQPRLLETLVPTQIAESAIACRLLRRLARRAAQSACLLHDGPRSSGGSPVST